MYFKIIILSVLAASKCINVSFSIYSDDAEKETYCYNAIRDELDSKIGYKLLLKNSSYNRTDKENLLKVLKSNNQSKEHVNKFFEGSHNVETFLVKNKRKEIILLVGKANGATGIGVDYWNYQNIFVEEDEPMLEFSSLIKTPHSIFINNTGSISHIDVDDNYPRPANGEEVQLDFFPMLVNVFNGNNKEIEFSLKCNPEDY